jgi:outer membrane protein assembly factor BamB
VITAADTAGLPGTTLALTATAYDAAGAPVPSAAISWLSFDQGIATVDATGGARLVTPGSVSVAATERKSGAADTVILHVAREGELKWTLSFGGDSAFTVGGPALGPDGTVYVLTLPFYGTQEVSDLWAVSPRGRQRWRLRLDRTGDNGHLIGPDGTIYVTGRTIRAITTAGTVLWSRVLLDPSGADFTFGALAPTGVLIVAPGPRVLALSATTGDTVWAGPISGSGRWIAAPTVAGPTVWIKQQEESLYAFSRDAGVIGRTIADPDTEVGDLRAFGTGAAMVGSRLYLPTAFRLAAFDTSGILTWLTDNRGRGVTEPVIDPVGNVYVQTSADGLLALEPAAGAWRWRRLACQPRWVWHGGPALGAGGVIYCAALDGFFAFGTNGDTLWSYQTAEGGSGPVPFIGAPVIATDGTVYTYTDTRLYAFWASHPPEPDSPWSMWRHDAQRTGVAR